MHNNPISKKTNPHHPSGLKNILGLPFKLKPLSLLMCSMSLSGYAVADIQEQDIAVQASTSIETPAKSQPDSTEEVERVVITGSRLRNAEFSSDLPVQVLTSEMGRLLGAGSLQELIGRSTLLTGAPQANNQNSVSQIGGASTNGGTGTNTLSLRGLGAERTLVLLDGRRLTPTGIGGGVSTPNISILPSSIITRTEILKDGASSIYGSDAVAGVVDNRLVGRTNQDVLNAYTNITEDGGAEFYQLSGRWSKIFEDGYINVAAQVDTFKQLRIGDRDYTACRDPLFSDANTGENIDIRDANGDKVCNSFGNNNRFYFYRGGTGNYYDVNSINGRFSGYYVPDPDGTIVGPGQQELRGIIPEFARVGVQNLGVTNPNNNVGAGAGNFQDVAASNALLPQTSDFIQNANAQNPEDRFSIFISGGYDLSQTTELYGQLLLSRLETQVNSFRYLYQDLGEYHPSNTVAERVREATNGDLYGDVGFNIIRPYYSNNETDYMNLVAGARGIFSDSFGLSWDIYAQTGRSDAQYTRNFTRQDRLDAVTGYRDVGCDPSAINPNLLEAGQTAESLCDGFSIPWLSPRILRDGQLNEQEMAFLEGEETGNTVYKQSILEGVLTGDLFSLPAGEAAIALGFHIRHDAIDDKPGFNSLAGNNHNFSNSKATEGTATVQELFTEIGIPVLENEFLAERLALTVSSRFTKNNRVDDNGEFTYKLGVAWSPVDTVKVRYNVGTSYRAPALYELFQGGTDSFGPTDPCQSLDQSQRTAAEVSNLRQNCGLFGIGGDYQAKENIRVRNSGNNTGTLRPETSKAKNVGIVWQPKFADLALAVDYFDIEVNDQIDRVGGYNIIERCLVEQSFNSIDEFNADPFCALLGDRTAAGELTEVTNGSINVAQQTSRGIDYTIRFDHQFDSFQFHLDGAVTQVLEDFYDQDKDIIDPVNDDFDRTLQALRPEYTANLNLSVSKDNWTGYWSVKYVGSSDELNYLLNDPNSGFNEDGTVQNYGAYRFLDPVKADTEVEAYIEHTASFSYLFESDIQITAGINNVFNQEPPQVGGDVERVGRSADGPYDFRGRRLFLRLSKVF